MRYWVVNLFLAIALNACASLPLKNPTLESGVHLTQWTKAQKEELRDRSTLIQRLSPHSSLDETEVQFQRRSLLIRQRIARQNLEERDRWWRRNDIGDPHKFLLPIILARLSLPETYDAQPNWEMWLKLERDRPDLYHFRSMLDVRIFFLHRHQLPDPVRASYQSMLVSPRLEEWTEGGTENHGFMQRVSGLALMDGSGFPVELPHVAETNEAWVRSQLDKFLTIGQGEFHSSTYYGYSIAGLLNLYDFAATPEVRELATALLDWYATNIALRLSWGTSGGAESRGFDRNTWNSGLSAVAWVWWGTPNRMNDQAIAEGMQLNFARLALAPSLSSYRPPEHLRAIAHKQVPLPFSVQASHPVYYSYHADNHLWETFYATPDYTLGTLLEGSRDYQVEGTIRAQYATYKLVIRDPNGVNNPVVSLGGTYHSPMAMGKTPGDQYLQERSAVIYQQILTESDIKAGVPPQSHLVLPIGYGEPRRHKDWYIWRIQETWLVAQVWGDEITLKMPVSEEDAAYQALAAIGSKTAWIVDVARVADYPTFDSLIRALARTEVRESAWETEGRLEYKSLAGDQLTMTYKPLGAIATATINGKPRQLENWPVLESPYVRQPLKSGFLEVKEPQLGTWQLRTTATGPQWEAKP